MMRRLPSWARAPVGRETPRALLLSILVGAFTGLLIVCFHMAIDVLSWQTLGAGATAPALAVAVPAAGAALAAWLVTVVVPRAQGSGVNHTKAALYVSDGYIPFSTVVGKFVACSAAIGSGNSLGPEDPALQMGAGIASLLGRVFRLTREQMRLIAPIGAAAGIAAAFNTPITGVLFVIEEVVATWNARVLGSIVLSAVSAVVVTRTFLGDDPLFRVPVFQLTHPSELIVYAVIGLVGGLLGAGYIWAIGRMRHRLGGAAAWRAVAQALVAGAFVGLVGLALPQVTGVGYGTVEDALHNRYGWETLLALAAVKMAVTAICFSSGVPGGLFAPTLFAGAMLGGGLAGLVSHGWPFPTSSVGAYVLVGMGTFFAAFFRAPMTSVFMVFEVSASYVIILPVMIANTVAYLVSRRLHPMPFFDMLSAQEGLRLPSQEHRREVAPIRVEDAMQPALATAAETAAADVRARMQDAAAAACFVLERGTWRSVDPAALAGADATTRAGAVADGAALPVLFRDEALDEALRRFGDCTALPVVSRADEQRLLGVLTVAAALAAYGIRGKGGG